MPKERILVVDDERNIVELIKYNLEKEGYEVICAYDGIEAVNIAKQDRPDLIILDVMLPGQGGLEVTRILRRETKTPIIMATAKGEEIDKILGLELGADDYVPKPFSPRELVARVKAVLRRTSGKAEEKDEIVFGNLSLNLIKHEVRKNGKEVELKPKEFDLLYVFMKNAGRVLTRQFLEEAVWGIEYVGTTRAIDATASRLRGKLGPLGERIAPVKGLGYKFT